MGNLQLREFLKKWFLKSQFSLTKHFLRNSLLVILRSDQQLGFKRVRMTLEVYDLY